MRSAELLRAAQVLSASPLTDRSLAFTLIRRFGAQRRSDDVSLDDILEKLALGGALTSDGETMRITLSLQHQLRERLADEEPETFASIASILADYLGGSEGARASYDTHGRDLLIAFFSLAAEPARESQLFDEFISLVGRSAGEGRQGESHSASRLLSALPESPDRRRQQDFLHGLSAWNDNDFDLASTYFEGVVAGSTRDRAFAIAAHLLAAYGSRKGDLARAVQFARDAVFILRQLDDRRGLAMTLTTLGRIERDLLSAAQDDQSSGLDPIATLNEAVEIGFEVGRRQGSVALTYLASALSRMNLPEEALDAVTDAWAVLREHPADPEALHAATLLGSLHRSLNNLEEASEFTRSGLEVARVQRDRRALARLLNVQASIERRRGHLDAALSAVEESVELGHDLGDERHLGHAYHTLAVVLLAQAEGSRRPDVLDHARDAARSAHEFLTRVRDRRGALMVERTLQSVDEARARE
jgi:tetratricopeptide (TPR) repeat protein